MNDRSLPSPLEFPDFSAFKANFGRNADQEFTLVNLNIRSLRKYREQFKVLADKSTGVIDIFVLTEINAPQSCLELLTVNGYCANFITRPVRRGGGIAVFVSEK